MRPRRRSRAQLDRPAQLGKPDRPETRDYPDNRVIRVIEVGPDLQAIKDRPERKATKATKATRVIRDVQARPDRLATLGRPGRKVRISHYTTCQTVRFVFHEA